MHIVVFYQRTHKEQAPVFDIVDGIRANGHRVELVPLEYSPFFPTPVLIVGSHTSYRVRHGMRALHAFARHVRRRRELSP